MSIKVLHRVQQGPHEVRIVRDSKAQNNQYTLWGLSSRIIQHTEKYASYEEAETNIAGLLKDLSIKSTSETMDREKD